MTDSISGKTLFILSLLFLFTACGLKKQTAGAQDIPKKARQHFKKGYDAYNYGNYDEAILSFQAALKKHPQYVDALDGLATTYKEKGEANKAIHTYRRLLDVDAKHFYAISALGELYYEERNFDSSRYFYKAILNTFGREGKQASNAQRRLDNIDFAEWALKNPVNISPTNLGEMINSDKEEYSPMLTIDEQRLYLTYRDGTLHPSRQNEDIVYATKEDGVWQKVRNLGPPINTIENEGAFSVSSDANYIFFTACSKPGGLGQCDIWLTMNKGNTWTTPKNIGQPINSRYWESQPSISADGHYLYFVSDRPGGFGGTDIWVSHWGDAGWETPVNLGPEINTHLDEQFPFIHPDGVTLYFSSEGHIGLGKSDLYVTRKNPDGEFEKPTNLGYPINSFDEDWNLIVARDGETAYYSSNNSETGFGGMDIYSFKLPKAIQAKKVSYARGLVRDAKTKKPLSSILKLIPLSKGEPTITTTNAIKGTFLVPLVANERYSLIIDKPGYLFYSEYFDMPNVNTDEPFELIIDLEKVEKGKIVILKNIFFDTDKFEIKPESKSELDKLVEFLTNNPTRKIEIGGHTDNQGAAAYNKTLSTNRAKAVADYLISKGIEAEKLSYKGYGDTQPIADNNTKEGRSKNRRTEFKIIE
jgi:flagellar motor protein MotB